MERYFLGIDVGGTKTHAIIASESGHVIGFGETGPGNHEGVGYEGLAAALQEATRQALAQSNLSIQQIAGAGFGVGGYDWPSELEPTLATIHTLGLESPVEVVNDAMIGLIAGASRGWGVGVVAGTGCNCWGRDQYRRIAHMTGCGWFMAEAGGAGEVVEEALRRIALEWSWRGPATRLTPAFIQYLGAKNLDDMLEGLVLEWYSIGPEAARVVFQVAHEGDLVAQDVIAWTGRQLGDMAVGVIRQLGFETLEFEVVLVGSLYNGGELLIEPMRKTIHAIAPGAQLVRLSAPPAVGAVLLGMEAAGIKPETAVRKALIQSVVDARQTA